MIEWMNDNQSMYKKLATFFFKVFLFKLQLVA